MFYIISIVTFLKRYLYSPSFYILLLIAGYFSFTKLIDLDLGFHLAQGKYFFENHFSLPRVEIFSFSKAGQPNVIISWLFDVLFYGTYLLGGLLALSLWKAIMVSSIVALFIFRLEVLNRIKKINVSRWWIYGAAALFLIATYNWINVERPHVLGYVFFSLFLLIFSLFVEKPKKWHWISLVVIQILWANTHTSFASGIGFTGLFWLGLVIEYFFKSNLRTSQDLNLCIIKKVFVLEFLQAVVSIINPYGIFIYLNVFKASLSSNLHLIKELWPMEPQELLTLRGIFFFLAIIPMARFLARKDFKMIFTYLAFVILGFKTGRLFFDFVVFSSAFTFAEIFELVPAWVRENNKIAFWPALFLLIYFGGSLSKSFDHGIGISENTLPVKTADFILEHKIPGPMFNAYGVGSYLIWRLYPNYQVYIDGRAPVYDQPPNNIITEYYAVLGSVDEWKKAAQKYNFNMAVVDWPFVVDGKLYNTTEKNLNTEEWTPVFFDTEAIVYVRNNDENKKLIDQYGYKFIKPQQLDPQYFQEYTKTREAWEGTRSEFERATRDNPTNYRTYFMYASFLAQTPGADERQIVGLLKKTLDLNAHFEQARDILEQNYRIIY